MRFQPIKENIQKNIKQGLLQRDCGIREYYQKHIQRYNSSKKRKVDLKRLFWHLSLEFQRVLNISLHKQSYEEIDGIVREIKFHNVKTLKNVLSDYLESEEEYYEKFSGCDMGLPYYEYEDFINLIERISYVVSEDEFYSIKELL